MSDANKIAEGDKLYQEGSDLIDRHQYANGILKLNKALELQSETHGLKSEKAYYTVFGIVYGYMQMKDLKRAEMHCRRLHFIAEAINSRQKIEQSQFLLVDISCKILDDGNIDMNPNIQFLDE